MLRLVLKKDDQLKIGNDIIIQFLSEGRVSLAVDAPKEVRIDRIEAPKPESISKVISGPNGKKQYAVMRRQ